MGPISGRAGFQDIQYPARYSSNLIFCNKNPLKQTKKSIIYTYLRLSDVQTDIRTYLKCTVIKNFVNKFFYRAISGYPVNIGYPSGYQILGKNNLPDIRYLAKNEFGPTLVQASNARGNPVKMHSCTRTSFLIIMEHVNVD